MDTFLDVTGIVKRAKQVLNFKNDSELAEYLGISRATVSNWGARNSIDFRLLLDKFGDKVDYNWLLLGKGNPKHQPRHCESELVKEKWRLYTIRKQRNRQMTAASCCTISQRQPI